MRIKLTQGKSVDFAFLLSIVKQLFCKMVVKQNIKKQIFGFSDQESHANTFLRLYLMENWGTLMGPIKTPMIFFMYFPRYEKIRRSTLMHF